jgi:hypothetical protein
MQHFWQNVDGYLTHKHPLVFNKMMDLAPKSGTWVEIGSWKGKSASYCVVELMLRGMKYDFHCVDPWTGSEEHENLQIIKEGKLFEEFMKNTLTISHLITPHKMTSEKASKKFEDNSVDVIFIDGDHSYEGVKTDLECWFPKIKSGGVIAYDDYPKWPSVAKAVHEFHNNNGYPIPEDLGQVIGRVGYWVKP